MDYESFVHELHQVQSRTGMLVTGMKGATPADPAAIERLLVELDTIIEELQVTDEEVRVLHHQLTETQETLSGDRDRYRDLFGVAQQFPVGRSLAMLVATETDCAGC